MTRLVAMLVLALIIGSPITAQAADRTSALLAELDRCDPRVPATYAPKLDVLLALADGRSALELAGVLGGTRACIGHVTTYGNGADELVFIGGHGAVGSTGALLWVDRGYWRIAALPLGYFSGTGEVRREGEARELFAGIGSTGSAGTIGVLGVRILGATATVTLQLTPGGEFGDLRILDDDHVYIAGRLTNDRLFTWATHPAWPGGAQWIFERRGTSFVQIAQRQSRDPDWLTMGFIGALLQRDAATMRQFATDSAVAQALDLPLLDRRIEGVQLFADSSFTTTERMSWSALPDGLRTIAAPGPVFGTVVNYDDHLRTVQQIAVRFDRAGDGWVISAFDGRPLCATCVPRIVP